MRLFAPIPPPLAGLVVSAFAVDQHSLRAAGLAFKRETSAVVMRDVVVHMGPHGLGLSLDNQHGGVVVSNLELAPDVHQGQVHQGQVGRKSRQRGDVAGRSVTVERWFLLGFNACFAGISILSL